MYEENDLYNLDLDENSTSETANADQQTSEQPAQQKQPEQPTADSKNPLANPEPQKSQDNAQAKNQLSEEQIAYIERAR